MLVQDLNHNVKSSCFSDNLFQTEEDVMVLLIKKCLADEVPYLNILSGIIFFFSFPVVTVVTVVTIVTIVRVVTKKILSHIFFLIF